MSLLHDVQIGVLENLSFQELFDVLNLDRSREIWRLHGLRDLWKLCMNRYSGPFSVLANDGVGTSISWEWVEERRYKIREMDLFIYARKQGRLGINHPSVINYILTSAQSTMTVMLDDEVNLNTGGVEFSRQYDLWASRLSSIDNPIADDNLWNANVHFRKLTFVERMLPRENSEDIIHPRLRQVNPPVGMCTYSELTNNLYWEFW